MRPRPTNAARTGRSYGVKVTGVRVSCCNSIVLPAGSLIQTCTVPPPCTARSESIPGDWSSAIAASRSATATQW